MARRDYAKTWMIAGHNPTVSTTRVPIWQGTGTYVPLPAAAETLRFVSDAAGDSSTGTGGTGIRTVGIHGLDADYNEQTEVISLLGAAPVDTTNTYIRINSIHATTVGSGGKAAGTILCSSTGGTEYTRIIASCNKHLTAHWTVPNGYTAYINQWSATLVTDKKDTFGMVRLGATVYHGVLYPGVYMCQDIVGQQAGTVQRRFTNPVICPGKTDIMACAIEMAGTGVTYAACIIEVHCELDTYPLA